MATSTITQRRTRPETAKDARQQYERDSAHFLVEPETFKRLCDLSGNLVTWQHKDHPRIEACVAELLVACRDFPLRLLGERLVAWDGTVWSDEPNTVLWVIQAYLKEPAVLNQYTLETGRWPTHDDKTGGTIVYEVERQRLNSVVGDKMKEWYRRPERAIKALAGLVPVERDDGDRLLHADRMGWLNTPGGIYNLADADALPVTDDTARRNLEPVRRTRVGIGTLADCPKFLAVLQHALPDPAVRDYFQLLMGYAATGLVREDIVIWCLGEAATGKTTILGAIQHALGSYAAQNDQTALLRETTKFPRLNTLRGARLVVMSEMERKYHIASGRLKELSGGNLVPGDPGTTDWRPQFTMAVESNHMPHLNDTSNGTRRRLRVIPFDVVVPEGERDTALRGNLRGDREASGILAWLLDGARRYYASGLGPTPDAIKRATSLVFVQDDPERAFYDLLMPSVEPVPFSTLYDELACMCARAKRPAPVKRTVSAVLKDRGFPVKEGHARKLEVWATLDAA